jgi:hypothetical protein
VCVCVRMHTTQAMIRRNRARRRGRAGDRARDRARHRAPLIGPAASPLFTNVVEVEFCELRQYGVLGS